jgi:hypothetical protein
MLLAEKAASTSRQLRMAAAPADDCPRVGQTRTSTVCNDIKWRQDPHVENGLHRVLDVTMNQDQSRNRKDHGPENIAMLRRLALNLAKLEGSKGSVKGKLKRAGWDAAVLTRLLAAFGAAPMRQPGVSRALALHSANAGITHGFLLQTDQGARA